MKVNVEIDCTPEEARRFMGLPDVAKANDVYVDAVTKAMKGVTSADQLQDFAKQLAPMGQIGMNLFQQFMEKGPGAFGGMGGGLGGGTGGSSASKSRKRNDDD